MTALALGSKHSSYLGVEGPTRDAWNGLLLMMFDMLFPLSNPPSTSRSDETVRRLLPYFSYWIIVRNVWVQASRDQLEFLLPR
jgi:hypothetical protein